MMDKKKIVVRLTYIIFFIFVINFLANKFYWYSSIWYLDMFMHFLGGFWIGLVSLYFLFIDSEFPTSKFILKILLCVLFVGIGWEVYEILINDVIARNSFNSLDTLSDIFFDLSGGLCAILYIWKKQLK